MPEFELLIAAHEANDALGLNLTPAQIVKALERHEGKRPARTERPHYADPTASEGIYRADRDLAKKRKAKR